MSPQGKIGSTLTVSFLGSAAEAGVYSNIAIALYRLIPTWWSISFIGAQLVIIIVGRWCAIMLVFYSGRLCCKRKTINFRELNFITYAGMIRGVIAFALVLNIPKEGDEACESPESDCISPAIYEVMVSTTLILVMVTTVVFGTFMSKVG